MGIARHNIRDGSGRYMIRIISLCRGKGSSGPVVQLTVFLEMKDGLRERLIGKINRGSRCFPCFCIYHGNADAVITRGPEVLGSSLSHSGTASVHIPFPCRKDLHRAGQRKEEGIQKNLPKDSFHNSMFSSHRKKAQVDSLSLSCLYLFNVTDLFIHIPIVIQDICLGSTWGRPAEDRVINLTFMLV